MTSNAKDFAAINGLYDPLEQTGPNPGLLRKTINSLIGMARAYFEQRTLRSTVRALQAMDDRLLADIGMSRGEIHSVVYGGASDATRRLRTVAE
jgi:uncharacterized protein YjiS (DUF1127 family)